MVEHGARDRDERGRARNARPRDELGRPLPRGAVGVDPLPDELVLEAPETIALAQQLLDAGRPFQAHEVLEAAWKAAPEPERTLWQGLAQLAVGVTHAARGNTAGAIALLRRGSDRVAAYTGQNPHGLDPAGVVGWAAAAVARLEHRDDDLPALRLTDSGQDA